MDFEITLPDGTTMVINNGTDVPSTATMVNGRLVITPSPW